MRTSASAAGVRAVGIARLKRRGVAVDAGPHDREQANAIAVVPDPDAREACSARPPLQRVRTGGA